MGKGLLLLILLKIIHLFCKMLHKISTGIMIKLQCIHLSVIPEEALSWSIFNLVVMCDYLKHDTLAVHFFQRNLVKMLKNKINFDIKKLIYFSNGTASHHKNYKTFFNLGNPKADFEIDAQWHFFTTSHRKGPCDGLCSTVKRLAAKTSLQQPYNEWIMIPRQLFDFVRENILGINTVYCSMEEWKNEADILEDRFYNSTTIIGTQKLHSFIPVSQIEVGIKTVNPIWGKNC